MDNKTQNTPTSTKGAFEATRPLPVRPEVDPSAITLDEAPTEMAKDALREATGADDPSMERDDVEEVTGVRTTTAPGNPLVSQR